MDYVPVFIANGFYKNRTEFKREHVVYSNFTKFPKIDRYINQGRLARHRAQVLVHMPYERHTRRRRVEVELPHDKQTLERVLKDRWNVYTDKPLRDVGEMFQVARRVVNSDPSRLEMVCELWEKHPKLIIFYNFNYELESLRSLKEYYGLLKMETGTPTRTVSHGSGVTTSMPTFTGGSSTASKSSKPAVLVKKSQDFAAQVIDSHVMAGVTEPGNIRAGSAPTSDSRGLVEWSPNSTTSSSMPATSSGLPQSLPSMRVQSPSPSGIDKRCSDSSSNTKISSRRTSLSTSTELLDRFNGSENTTTTENEDITQPSLPTMSTEDFSTIPSTLTPDRTTPRPERSSEFLTPEIEHSFPTVSIAEWNGHKHEPIPTTDRWLYLVQYTAGAEAWNCITTDAMVMYSLNYSWKVIEQSEGRIDRMNTRFHELWYYKFMSDSWIDKAILRALEAKETFNEGKFKGLFAG